MPTTGVSGIDMYQINQDGESNYCFGGYSFRDTIAYTYSNLQPAKYHKRGHEYHVALPLYNSVSWMEIGTKEGSEFKFVPVSKEKPILLYGTSIAQGACASRPSRAWSNIVQRNLELPLINLGFSGNGRLEPEVIDFINQNEAQVYILDCIPNLCDRATPEEVKKLVKAAVAQIRSKHAEPILLVEHAGYSNGTTEPARKESYSKANIAQKEAFDEMMKEGAKELYYLSREDMEFPADGWVDYVHPSDYGMQAQADAVTAKLRDILRLPADKSISTTYPVSQRREPDTYEWKERHEAMLQAVRDRSPKKVIIGNSITHYWGGTPSHARQWGKETWAKFMEPAGIQNLGCGWDRIENVLWRIEHGELDGYEAEEVILMIGTNNYNLNTDQEIVDGLRYLVRAIKGKQPGAKVKVVGILPRRDAEKWVKDINKTIKKMAKEENCQYVEAGKGLLLSNGKIDESLFIGDGLHPSDKGYATIAPALLK
jgi:lysophospholipase L1-like esterase